MKKELPLFAHWYDTLLWMFERADLCLDRIRVLARILFDLRILSLKQYERLALNVDEAGRMVGGWRKAAGRERATAERGDRKGGFTVPVPSWNVKVATNDEGSGP